MKKYILIFLMGLMLLSCGHEFFNYEPQENIEEIFGTTFNPNHDWCSTDNKEIILGGLDADSIKVLASVGGELKLLNNVKYSENMNIYFDAPKGSDIFICTIKDNKQYFYLLDDVVRKTRSGEESITIPTTPPAITGTVQSYEQKRGYPGFENEILYTTNLFPIEVSNYSESFLTTFRAVLFTYLPNGKSYNNLPKILAKGYYNNDCYAVTTGEDPILVSLMYKNDGGYHEVETGELYYYYFKGNKTVEEIKTLPKYKALDIRTSMSDDDVINKKHSYVLAYFDGETPTYQFPKGYKIGFMLRVNFKDDVKKGELYFDGRLNSNINRHGHFASSGLGDDDPRMCWVTVNKRMFMCCEAGTDSDFNDAIFEIEGVEPIDIPIDPEYNYYTYLFEDRNYGDYDMNDVVLRGTRIDETHVKWEVVATGAYDELYIYNINGKVINSTKEVHSYFNVEQETYVNVGLGVTKPIVSETLVVKKDFSFLNNMPYIKNVTQNNRLIYLSTVGQNPHAIMIPFEMKWPIEKICIKDAYLEFNDWGKNPIASFDWYIRPVEEKVVQ